MSDILLVGSGRVWTIPYRAGPTHEPEYHGLGMAGAIDWGQGDVNKIERPSDLVYNQWDQIQSFQMSPDRATITITVYMEDTRSAIMELIRKRCPFDIQVHMGACGDDPRDFDGGWHKVRIVEDALATGYTTADLGALDGESQDNITEEMPTSGRSVYDVLRMAYFNVAQGAVGEVVVAIDVCDLITCGDCPGVTASDGCQRVFAVTNSKGSSPGLLPQVIITTDQFGIATIIERWVTTFALAEDAKDAACIGDYFVVISDTGDGAIHYANAQDMVDQVETWTKVITGFPLAGAKAPNAIWNYSPLLSFLAGKGGYVYLMKNPADGVTVLSAGTVTTQDLNDISGWDSENFAAVGQAGAFVYALDGKTVQLGTAPVGPTNLLSVAFRSKNEIWVGGDDGKFYVTSDYGDHWTTKTPPGNLTRIDAIGWASDSVGYAVGRTVTPAGRAVRTFNGGYSWYVVPETPGMNLPASDYLTCLALCMKEVNKVFLGGLADNAADGILIKGTDI